MRAKNLKILFQAQSSNSDQVAGSKSFYFQEFKAHEIHMLRTCKSPDRSVSKHGKTRIQTA